MTRFEFPYGHNSQGNFGIVVRRNGNHSVLLDLDRDHLSPGQPLTAHLIHIWGGNADERLRVSSELKVGDVIAHTGVKATLVDLAPNTGGGSAQGIAVFEVVTDDDA